MRTAICTRPGLLEMADTPRPVPGADDVLVRVRRMGVCGTDLHAFRGRQPFFTYPRVLGHELAGEVVEVGADATGFAVGEPVIVVPYVACGACIACRRGRPNCCARISVLGVHADGGMRDYLTVPARNLVRGAGLDWESMALVECLAIGAHAVRRAEVVGGETVLVIGAGPIGLGVLQYARLAGARTIAMDVTEGRLAFWRDKLGGPTTIAMGGQDEEAIAGEIAGHTDGEFPLVVIDATGHAGSMAKAIRYAAPGGRVVYVGLTQDDIVFPHPELHRRELDLRASRNATAADFDLVVRSLREGTVEPSCMVTHRAGLEEGVARFADWTDPAAGVIKAVLTVAD